MIHEFCHAYCNPIIDKRWNSIAKKAEEAFRIKKRILSQQAYVTAKIMMYETLVRTSVIRYEQQHNSNTDVWQLIYKEEELGFILVADFLKAWNQNHASNPGDILAESINNFSTEAYCAKVAEEEKRSVNYTCNITDGEKNVASGDFTFTITFDRQMELWSRHTWQAVSGKRWQQIDRKNHLFQDWQMSKILDLSKLSNSSYFQLNF